METEAAASMLGIMEDNGLSSRMVVVNAPIPQRRGSSFTTVSSEDEDSEGGNLLLRLVDAASRLEPGEPCEAATTDSGVEHGETKQHTNMDVDEAQATQKEFKRTIVQQTPTPKSSSSSSSSSAARKVITGTKEDLIMSPNQKMSFAEQLYDVLDNEQHHDVLQWMPDGLSFTITNHKKFTLDKMPKLFNIRNMSSFVRKLGRWGFSRVHEKATNNSDIFKHPEFIRNERENVKRRVKCLGRANISGNNNDSNAPSSPGASSVAPHHHHQLQQHHYNHHHHHHRQGSHPIIMRQPDFVVPSKVSNTNRFPEVYSDHPVSPALQQHHAFGAYPRGGGGGGGGGGVTHPSMDKVTAASAASAEALYLCHQQQQHARMEQLAMEQQELEDREIQNLMKQRAVRIRQRLQADQHQQRHFVDTTHHHQQQPHHHQRMQRNASDGIPPPPLLQRTAGVDGQLSIIDRQLSPSSQPRQSSSSPPATGAVGGGTDNINNSAVSSPRMEADRLHLPHLRHQHQHHQHQQQHHHQQHYLHQPKPHQAMTMMGNMDIRSPIIQSPLGRQSSFVDVRQAYGGTFTGGPTDDSSPRRVSPGNGEQSLRVNMSYDQLSPEELRSMERKNAIRALLKEEQEWESSMRGGGGSGSGGMGGVHQHQCRTSYNSPMMVPPGGGAWQQHEQHLLQPPLSPQEIHQGNAPPFYR